MKQKKTTKLSARTLKFRIRRKTNPELNETIREAMRSPAWSNVAKILSGATRKYSSLNLSDLEKKTTAGDTVLILGKVLGSGELTKKLRIVSLGISAEAKEKLKKTKSEHVTVLQEIKTNKKMEGVKLI